MILENILFQLWLQSLRLQKKVLSFFNPVSLQEQVKAVNTLCICMPKNHTHFNEAFECVKNIQSKHIIITLIHDRQEKKIDFKGKLLPYPEEAKREFPISRKRLEKIPERYDIAIDLSPEPSILSAYITGTRGKKMTIGIKSGELDVFYTALIDPAEEYKKAVKTMIELAGLHLTNQDTLKTELMV